jgi:hypothetical protein
MKYTIFDLECDGLLDVVTKLHCFCYQIYEKGVLLEKGALVNPNDIITFLDKQETIIGHNIIRFDIPVLKKILGWKKPKELKIIDTMGLSWYLYIGRKSHGLESFGEEFGVPKPKISDWSNLTVEEYIHRCSEDVEINQILFHNQMNLLSKLYRKYDDKIRIINYLNFKMDCLREQEEVKIKIDTNLLYKSLNELKSIYTEKSEILKKVMPEVYKYKEVKKPEKMTLKNGSLSEAGKKWEQLLNEKNLPIDYEGNITVLHKKEEPNPGSVDQIKKWLYSLGWKPNIFDKKTKVAQIYDENKKVSLSVKELYPLCPELENLDMMSMIKNRINTLKGFEENLDSNNFSIASAQGFTNTLRFTHVKPVANLVKVGKFYGEQIRGLITVPNDDYLFCGSDCSALEDTTKQNYMMKYDAEYVKEMRTPGFDPHIDIALLSGLLSKEEVLRYKELDKKKEQTPEEHKEFVVLKNKRGIAKVGNFSMTYGAQPKTVSESINKPIEDAQKLFDIYWERNWSVKKIAEDFRVRIIFKDGSVKNYINKSLIDFSTDKNKKSQWYSFMESIDSMWLLNPYSNFYYSLRKPKDAFSTGNQGLGVWCFDNFVREVRKKGIKISLQYHDEIGFVFLRNKYTKEEILKKLKECISKVNERLQLPIPIDISADFGVNYAECH